MIEGAMLRDAMISGSNNIAKYRGQVNDLNIFPVPDGDTGSNMSMTIGAAADELLKLSDTVTAGEVAAKAAAAMLRGARGNSGVILSLLFRGISKGLENIEAAGCEDILRALDLGVEAAYKAVTRPTEGTILTVARVAAERGREALTEGAEPVNVWEAVCNGAAEALEETPELLPVLKRAGVVDAGGQGLCLIFEGMLCVFQGGGVISSGQTAEERKLETEEFFRSAAAEFDSEINFTYCTEFVIGRDPEVKKDPMSLRRYLEGIGDCVLVADDEEIIKVHVHTEEPGNALQKGLSFGQLLSVKIDNMREQHRKLGESQTPAEPEPAPTLERQEPTEELGFISVAAGEGLKSLFLELGCTVVVSGGQTMNPSTEDILSAVLATPAKKVFVLPNNKNILLAAEQTIPLAEDREVIVLPTKTLPQGLSAMLAFDEGRDPAGNVLEMTKAADRVGTGQITFAARDSDYDGYKIKEGELLGLENGKVSFTERDLKKAAVKLTKALLNKESSFVTVIYGEDISEEQAAELETAIREKLPDQVDLAFVNGGQPVYYLIISVE